MPVEENPENLDSLFMTTGRTKDNDIEVAPMRGLGSGPSSEEDNHGVRLRVRPAVNANSQTQPKLPRRPAITIDVSDIVEQNTRNLPTMNAVTTQTSEAISCQSFAG